MEIKASQVKELRDMTGVAMMDCKKALVESDGDIEKAVDLLRSNSALKAEKNNIAVIIAGAGGSAHLPGMISALTSIPVLGVPIESKKLKGLDSLLSIAQMPKGIPVGTLAIGEDGAINAALLAASIIANQNASIKRKLINWRSSQTKSVKKNPK